VVARLAPPTPLKNERTPQFTNDSRPFNRESQAPRTNNPAPPPTQEGFKPFTPPAGQQNNSQNHTDQQAEPQQRPPVHFTPPTKAKEEEYDVHPPLNQKPEAQPREQSKPAPKPPEPKPAPAPKPDKPHGR
jgi:hypothetical protein